MYEQNILVRQGWQCPICHRVYSPDTIMCYYCGNTKLVTSTTTGTEINEDILNICMKKMQEDK